jgi:DNA polymerase III subunit epsilon
MNLVYDTETTGLPDFKARSADPSQPHLVQLALVTYDDLGVEFVARSMIVRPDGWIIPPEATAIHGITQERAMDEGIPEHEVVAAFVVVQGSAAVRVAHNESFDRRIMRIAMTRAGYARDFIELIEARESFCTCNAAKPIVNLPPTDKMLAVGFKGPKSPSLIECMSHFFNEPLDGAHDALVDARACARLYHHLRTMEKAA